MANIKPLEQITAKWRSRAQVSTEDYRAGVLNPRTDWQTATIAAAASYKAGIQAALNANRFEAGVRAAGSEKWQQNAATKGPSRWAEGINLSGDAYAKGFAKFHQVLSTLSLPPRGPRGDAKNYERSMAVGKALHAARVGAS